jgi:tetratricopeptide (TPR) repeat protein
MFFIAAVTLKFFRPLWIDNRWQDRVLVASGFAAWLALIVHSLVDFNLHIPANALLLSALTGLGLGRIREDKAPHWSTLSLDSLGRLTGMALLILGLLYGSEVARTLVSENLYEKTRADEDVLAVSNSIQDADEALRYDSGNVADLVLLGDLHQFRASLEKDSALRQGERQKAIEAYQQALQANGPDDVVQARLTAARDLAQQDSAAH